MSRIICPLLSDRETLTECASECAWFDRVTNRCVVRALSATMSGIIRRRRKRAHNTDPDGSASQIGGTLDSVHRESQEPYPGKG